MKQVVCKEDELIPGQIRIVTKGKAPVLVVCSADNEYHAIRGICPHQGALLSRGILWPLTVSDEPGVYELTSEMEILRCPWHSFDFDVKTGKCISDARLRVKTYPVYVENKQIVVDL